VDINLTLDALSGGQHLKLLSSMRGGAVFSLV